MRIRNVVTLSWVTLTSDCWLEVTMHLEGPATGQINHDFPWVPSTLRANAGTIPTFQVFAARLSCSPASSNFKISAQTQPTSG
jgi:hypothetical protein